MAFIKRLGWYLVGLSIGIIFLAFFLKKKSEETGTSFCYFPNCRVLKDIRSKPITYSDEVAHVFKVDSITWKDFFEEGNVDFGKSDTKSKPCKIYFISNKEQTIKVKNCPDKVEVVEVY
ncbi:DUF4258 domain-containing protein [Croceitalea rosinachiae]|uniref:DUF4258 domain-containing protein n=1 Tax=Croceitalea rosinachiae TaxID=3075596 RepID=A0ABU3ACF0_9FLAO|nr:DUF4258 domain-containing protein [Croceitalea sp. F388]MDT0607475.1 DUF4258 domain-containing protein [Croceitalea sp. F388]